MTSPAYDTDDKRWNASRAREAAASHVFYICVKTTGVYCLSTCAGRPLRKNVFFVSSRDEAEAAGMRACKRCKPDRPG